MPFFQQTKIILAILLSFWGSSLQAAQPPLVIVSSILPIHSLVVSLTQNVPNIEAKVLLSGSFSPHTYVLRPSDRRLLQKAQLLFWIGPDLELFLSPMISRLPPETETVALMQVPGLRLWPNRGTDDHHDHHGNHQHLSEEHKDPHIWLSVSNAIMMAKTIEQHLIAHDPSHRAQYKKNGLVLIESLKKLDQQLKTILTPYQHQPIMVFHDGYQYFEKAYGLTQVYVITAHPEAPFTIAQKRRLHQTIQEQQLHCVFSEPQFDINQIRQWLGDDVSRTTLGVWDPLGDSSWDPATAYAKILLTIANHMQQCLDHKS